MSLAFFVVLILILFRYQQLIFRLHEMLDLPEIPEFTQPLESDPQYELVVKLSEVSTQSFYSLNSICF